MVLVNLAAAAMLMIKQAEKTKKIRIAAFILALGVIAAFSAVRSTRLSACFPRVRSPDIYRSNTCSGIYWMYFVFVPWKELIELKNAESRAQPPDCYGRSLTYLTSLKRIMSGTFNKFIAASSGTTCSKLSINS